MQPAAAAVVIAWLSQAPLGVLALIVFAAIYGLAAVVFFVVLGVSRRGAGPVLSHLAPGLLSPMGLLFGLLVGFLLAQVWGDREQAQTAVGQEASAIRDADLLMSSFPDPQQRQMRLFLRAQVDRAIAVEWPAMADGAANLSVVPAELVQCQRLALSLPTTTNGQRVAQSNLVTAIDAALQARRARIRLSTSAIDPIRLAAVALVAFVTLAAVACVHATRLGTAALALALFATAMAAVLTLLIADAGPFSGHFGIRPVLLEQVRPAP